MKKWFFISPLIILTIPLLTILLNRCNPDDYTMYQSAEFSVFPNRIEQGEFTAIAHNNSHISSNYPGLNNKEWKLEAKLSHYPKYQSNQVLLDAIYQLSLEEIQKNIAPDSTFNTGEKWAGVWTRDISYSVILALAIADPEISKKSLLKKVKHGKIVQDTGTGGAWPVSSDRMIWSTAAWEIYKSTGDMEWLRKAYFIIKNSTEDDLNVVWDYQKYLFKGESSFLDWREQSYPKWMEPADIFSSYSLGTQAVHYESLQVLMKMGGILGKDVQKYQDISEALKNSTNEKLWLPEKKYFGQYLYGRKNQMLSDKSETLGEALMVLWDVAEDEKQKEIISHTPVTKFGAPCFYPQIPNVPAYHNQAIWPFVQAYWNWASSKTNNVKSVELGIASMLRASALFLTNKENLLIENGDFKGTETNSDRQLWSAAGSLSTFYRILMGMNYTADYLEFKPFIPREYKGKQSIKGLRYQNAILDIDIYGFGDKISHYSLDGKYYQRPIVPKEMEGKHKIEIRMNNHILTKSKINLVDNKVTPETTSLRFVDNQLIWDQKENADHYHIYRNGELLLETEDNYMSEVHITDPTEFQIQIDDKFGNVSFFSEPLYVYDSNNERFLEAEHFDPYAKTSYVELSKKQNREFYFNIRIPNEGNYYIDFLYANGNGPINTDNKCAIRSFWVNNSYTGSLVFPQRGENNWENYGYSNSFFVKLTNRNNFFKISFEEFNKNMNQEINSLRIDKIRIIRAK
ncbi:hypothetical protein BZG02_15165 [Labilibaculum filiforme]|uniref:Alpha-L-rhamnosidase six-hairpin glycosidase domain-containing protein n=1 Tax=Labilibaculum filiforme TaxID=1940526 RepID=A0A2N3HU12_9BACT|nr:glycogen debranching protein [Labilibaculum filiforme]PKQ61529.1 hypothetical protein BZG02_15165 [Labilibaculum filiforme]